MYDRLSGSYWSQAMGQSIKGPLAGNELRRIPFDIARWSDWKSLYPDTMVLTTDTGFQRAYGSDPYGSYYSSDDIIFPVAHTDNRMHPKEKIVGYYDSGQFRAYKLSDLESSKVVNDKVGKADVLLVSLYPEMVRVFDRDLDGKMLDFAFSDGKIIDKETNSQWNREGLAVAGSMKGAQLQRISINPGFWFEWAAFHPTTDIYQG
jgi:hypothetical protein